MLLLLLLLVARTGRGRPLFSLAAWTQLYNGVWQLLCISLPPLNQCDGTDDVVSVDVDRGNVDHVADEALRKVKQWREKKEL